jgi:rabenosyn-5
MDEFKAIRKPIVDKSLLEVSRLEKRLTRLTQLLASLSPEQLQSNKLWPIPFQHDERKALEQTVVSWQDDTSVTRCPFCQQDFSSYTFRRHHCRTCGRVVCGDVLTGCSVEVPLSVTPCTCCQHSSNIMLTSFSVESLFRKISQRWFPEHRHQALQRVQVNAI